jgi:hypothetical protein
MNPVTFAFKKAVVVKKPCELMNVSQYQNVICSPSHTYSLNLYPFSIVFEHIKL